LDGVTRSEVAVGPQVEALAVQALEVAIERAVRTARGRDGIPGLADSAPTRSTDNASNGL
jgi:hypothetical protein